MIDPLPTTAQVVSPPALRPDGRLLVVIHGELYDLTEFVARHPGGALPLRLASGMDATELFESYHPRGSAREVLWAYRINAGTEPPPGPGPFTVAVQDRVVEYFTLSKLNPKASRGQCLWYLLVSVLYLSFLCGYWLGNWPSVFGLAVVGWYVFGMGHDGAHFAVSRRPWVNRLASLGLLTNMNVMVWYYHHTSGHHVRTNRSGDPDHSIAYPFIRTSADQPYRRWHRWQAVLLPLYLLFPTGLMTLVGPPLWLASRRAVRVVPMPYPGVRWWGGLSWAVSVSVLIVVPLIVLPMGRAIAFPIIYVILSGIIFSLNNFASHLSKDCFSESDCTDWARIQAASTINWRSGNWLASWLSVGVNHQIEHHLFPGINPEHYHRLSPIVRAVCHEFGVKYQSHRTFMGFVMGSLRWVRTLSSPPRGLPDDDL